MRINRAIVWILLLFMILLVITGYGLAKPNLIQTLSGGLLSYQVNFQLHTLLDVPLLIFLMIHVLVEVKFSLMRWGFRNQRLINALIALLGMLFLVLILSVDLARP